MLWDFLRILQHSDTHVTDIAEDWIDSRLKFYREEAVEGWVNWYIEETVKRKAEVLHHGVSVWEVAPGETETKDLGMNVKHFS